MLMVTDTYYSSSDKKGQVTQKTAIAIRRNLNEFPQYSYSHNKRLVFNEIKKIVENYITINS